MGICGTSVTIILYATVEKRGQDKLLLAFSLSPSPAFLVCYLCNAPQ